MKHSYRFFMILLALTLVIAISMTARAEDVTESGNLTDTVRYTLYADGTLVIEGTGEVEKLDEYPIGDFTALEIGEGISGLTYFWHNSKYNITRLSIPSTMKQMEYVFEACYALTDLELNEGIEVIGRSAFCNCTTLETVVFPSTVTEIGYKAFTNCWELKEVIFTGGPAAVSEVAFYNEMDNESLTVYYPADSGWTREHMTSMGRDMTTWIPYTLDEAGNRVADESQAYTTNFIMKTSGTLGENGSWYIDGAGVLHIEGTGAVSTETLVEFFWYDIAGLVVEPGVTDFWFTFGSYYKQLKCVQFTDALRRYPEFFDCQSLETIDFGAAKTISNVEFLFNIREVTIPASVTTIGNRTLNNSKSLESITFLGSAPAQIGEKCFTRVGQITFYYPAGDPSWTEAVMQKLSNATAVWIPYTLDGAGNRIPDPGQAKTFIGISDSEQQGSAKWTLYGDGLMVVEGSGTFAGNAGSNTIFSDVRRVEFRGNITGLDESAFAWCHQLEEITLPDSLEEIGKRAFYECTSLPEIEIPGSVTTIPVFCFENCTNLASVTLHEGLKYISDGAFYNAGVREIVIPSTVLDMGYDGTDAGSHTHGAFYECPLEKVTFLTDQLSCIPSSCFAYTNLQHVNIPEGITRIEPNAFAFSTLESVTLPESLQVIETRAFQSTNLTRVEIPASVQKLENHSFGWCYDLALVAFRGDLPQIGNDEAVVGNEGAFWNSYPILAYLEEYTDSFADLKPDKYYITGTMPMAEDENGNLVVMDWKEKDISSNLYAVRNQYPEGYSLGRYSVSKLNTTNLEGYGSQAFAYILSDALFGTMPSELDREVTFEEVKVGDILRMGDVENGRAVVVTEKRNDSVTVAQGDWHATPDAPGTVHWGETLNRSQVEAAEYRITRYVDILFGEPITVPTYEPQWPTISGQVTESAAQELILSLKGSYPEGYPYTLDITYESNFGQTGTACSAFAYRVSDMIFGTAPIRYITDIDFDDIMVGDILRYDPDPGDNTTHAVVVLEVYQQCVVTVEANYNDAVHWGSVFTREQVEAMMGYYTRYPEGTVHATREDYPGEITDTPMIDGFCQTWQEDILVNEAYTVRDGRTGEELTFAYEIPEDGATVLVFFWTWCSFSEQLLSELDECDWLDNPALRIVAIESENASTEEIADYIGRVTPDNGQYIRYLTGNYSAHSDYQKTYLKESLSSPCIVILTEDNGVPMVTRFRSGYVSAGALYKCLTGISEGFAFHEGHTHYFTIKRTVDPTCTEEGYSVYVCSCGKEEKRDIKAALGHTWMDATCDAPKTCAVCAQTDGTPLDHVYVDGVCSGCGKEEPDYVLGDADGDGTVTYMDAMLALQAAVGLGDADTAACDADGDGTVTYMDAMLILQAAVGLVTL